MNVTTGGPTMMNMTTTAATTEVNAELVFGPQRDSLYILIPITVIYTLIFVTGLLGNIFTCMVIVRNKEMHTATNYYLFSLAISDLLLLVSGMPQEMYSMWFKWPYIFGPIFCLIRALAAETSTNASILTITLFTVERYVAICHPFISHKMSKLSRAVKHIGLLWAAALVLALPQALQFGIRKVLGVKMCLQTRVIILHSFEMSTVFLFFAPMMLITILYLLIGLRLNKTNKENSEEDCERSTIITREVRMRSTPAASRVIKMLVSVVVAFFTCWAPFHAQRLVAVYGTTAQHRAVSRAALAAYLVLTYLSGVLYYLSTCINPILYHLMSNNFRDAFKETLFGCTRAKNLKLSSTRFQRTSTFTKNKSRNNKSNSGNATEMERPSVRDKRQDGKENRSCLQNVNIPHMSDDVNDHCEISSDITLHDTQNYNVNNKTDGNHEEWQTVMSRHELKDDNELKQTFSDTKATQFIEVQVAKELDENVALHDVAKHSNCG